MTPESKVKKKVKEVLKRFDVHYTMPVAGLYGKAGKPDFICCYCGRYIAIETKGEKEQTELQKIEEKETKKAGGVYLLVYMEDIYKLELLLQRIHDSQPK